MASAWRGLLQERGRIGAATSPTDHSTAPVGVQSDHGTVVMPLDEAGAHDLGDDGQRHAGHASVAG